MTSYPSPTLPAEIARAVDLALAFNLRLTGLGLEIAPDRAIAYGAYSMPGVGTMIEAEEAKTHAAGEEMARDFLECAGRHGVAHALRRVACDALDAPGLAAEAARLHDLSILTVAAGRRADASFAEAVVFGSGRPCLVLPAGREQTRLQGFERVLVAWDGGRAAARALADALPLLESAREVEALSVVDDEKAPRRGMDDLEQWFADHGVRAVCRTIVAGGRAADAILREAQARRSDLLVMGAFGHSRLRDFVLGGVTRAMLAEPTMPVLFSH
jgi:nucleotide-binding universal stress UspA family protein